MNVIYERSVPGAYAEAFWKMRVWAKEANSRNGPVMEAKDVFLEITKPDERVLFDKVRLANPFFHMMEFIWMMSGSDEVSWIEKFNSNIATYAEPNGRIHGAYGARWRHHFGGLDQVILVRDMLKRDPNTRRAVISMWDADSDLGVEKNDLPCNTHIYVTVEKEGLEFTVLNRSNDLVWGMLGANVVHMTMLQDIMAESLGLPLASYKVFTKNLHVYKSLPNFEEIWNTTVTPNPYASGTVTPRPILNFTRLEDFLTQCKDFIDGHKVKNWWLLNVATPMRDAYLDRLAGGNGIHISQSVKAHDWRAAAVMYCEVKELARNQAEEA